MHIHGRKVAHVRASKYTYVKTKVYINIYVYKIYKLVSFARRVYSRAGTRNERIPSCHRVRIKLAVVFPRERSIYHSNFQVPSSVYDTHTTVDTVNRVFCARVRFIRTRFFLTSGALTFMRVGVLKKFTNYTPRQNYRLFLLSSCSGGVLRI